MSEEGKSWESVEGNGGIWWKNDQEPCKRNKWARHAPIVGYVVHHCRQIGRMAVTSQGDLLDIVVNVTLAAAVENGLPPEWPSFCHAVLRRHCRRSVKLNVVSDGKLLRFFIQRS
eukprot:TRINITY_DN5758_c0_g4_i1.p3 TRINITY_DN5758_c0_g4~~TRINITY_DN5758_c0_g4_i1.p3  ORF type:complete len:115 (-),score=11.94 TRINITY_DN5758_c0_g4_i1:775-1119(-)